MIIGIGTDIIETKRVMQKVSKNYGFKEKVFTQQEIDYCESKTNKEQNYAVRFAAKEAFLKAIGTGWKSPLQFEEIEIVNDKSGKPELILHGNTKKFAEEKGIKSIHVSLSHLKDMANAIILLQTDDVKFPVNIHSTFINIKE